MERNLSPAKPPKYNTNPVGAGSPAIAMVNSLPQSRVNPLPQVTADGLYSRVLTIREPPTACAVGNTSSRDTSTAAGIFSAASSSSAISAGWIDS